MAPTALHHACTWYALVNLRTNCRLPLRNKQNACDDGKLARGQRVLFNGASFLIDIYENPETLAHYASAPSKACRPALAFASPGEGGDNM